MIYRKNYHSADYRDHNAVEVDPANTVGAESAEDPTSCYSADDPQDDVEEKSLTLFIHDLAGDKSCD